LWCQHPHVPINHHCPQMFAAPGHGTALSLALGGEVAATQVMNNLINARTDRSLDMLQVLLEAGLSPNRALTAGQSPLHTATTRNVLRAMQLLLQHGADPETLDTSGWTPLFWVTTPEAVDVLCAAHVHLDAVDSQGWTTLRWCVSSYPAVVTRLLERGADPNIPDLTGRTCIGISNNEAGVRELLRHRARLDVRDVRGYGPLHWAAANDWEVSCRALLQAWPRDELDVAATGFDGKSPSQASKLSGARGGGGVG
jgi:ankyrin repeat protein